MCLLYVAFWLIFCSILFKVASEGGSQMSSYSSHSQHLLQTESTLLRSESSYEYETSVNGKVAHSEIEQKDSVGASSEVGQQVGRPS